MTTSAPLSQTLRPLDSLEVRPIDPSERERWDSLMRAHHYLGLRWLAGESIKHVAILSGEWVALLGWAAAAFKTSARDRFIGWSAEDQFRRLRYLANNVRYLILPGPRIPHLASKTLALSTRRLSRDWETTWDHPIHLVETFVDPTRFAGTCYRAAGWTCVGTTRGFSYHSGNYRPHGLSKTVWLKSLHPQALALLSAPVDTVRLTGKPGAPLPLPDPLLTSLFTHLETVTDSRQRRGQRHSIGSALRVAVLGRLSGVTSGVALGKWVQTLSQESLERLGCRFHPVRAVYVPPSGATLRRSLIALDLPAFDQALEAWVADCSPSSPLRPLVRRVETALRTFIRREGLLSALLSSRKSHGGLP